MAQFELWLSEVFQEIVAGSGRGRSALQWAQEAQTTDLRVIASLQEPKAERVTWDTKCLQTLRNVAKLRTEIIAAINLQVKEMQN